ncbi:MAG: DUF3810 domain-containing protein [Ferruginibacter sp.]
MKLQRKGIIAIFLVIICVIIHLYSNNEMRVENGYSSHFSSWFSEILRYCFGWIPVSIGDFLYGLLVFWLIWKLFRFLGRMFRKGKVPSRKKYFMGACLKAVLFCSSIYIIFNIFWGINYNRKGIAWQIGLKMDKYSKEDLEHINCVLVDKINESKKVLIADRVQYPSNKELYAMVSDAYKKVSVQYSFLEYHPSSIKTSMWGWLGNYTGFTGYYNPFTGEAQLNTTVPEFLHPFIACHETAHQLGYSKEMEANFVGYLAASSSSSQLFHYSVYLDLFVYANRNLFFIDSTSSKLYRKDLDPAVVKDLKDWFEFNRKHQSPIEPVVRWIYGKYLESNSQPQGLLSYDEVTAFIISYYKKFGRI